MGNDWYTLVELIAGFSAALLSICFLLLVNIVLPWLPSRNFINLFLTASISLKASLFFVALFQNDISYGVFLLTFPLILLLGPVMHGFTLSTLKMQKLPTVNTKNKVLLAVGYILLLPVFLQSFAAQQLGSNTTISDLAETGIISFVVLFVMSSSLTFIPVLWRLYRGALYSVGYGDQAYHWLRGLWWSISAIWLILVFDTIASLLSYDPPGHTALFAIADLIVWVFLMVFTVLYCTSPKEEDESHCEESQKYDKSILTSDHATSILEKVEKLMLEQNLFLDSSLTLDKLAALIHTQPQYLSQAINQYREVNFYEFIARYRIEFAKQELIENNAKSILDIAMSAGFNTKSTFNLTFKKITGLTPSVFKKQSLA